MTATQIAKSLSTGLEQAKLATQLAKELKVIMKDKSAKKSHDAMTDDEALRILAKEIYSELRPEYQEHIRFEYLCNLVISQKKRFLKKEKTKKKWFSARKK